MAEKISSLMQLMGALTATHEAFKVEAEHTIAVCAVKVQTTAKAKFGTYQEAVDPFPAWAELAESTVKAKAAAGSNGDDPLIGHYQEGDHSSRPGGGLQSSIMVEVKGMVGEIGTNDPIAAHHEYGTKRIPPRPYLRPALIENEEFIKNEFRKAIAKGMMMR